MIYALYEDIVKLMYNYCDNHIVNVVNYYVLSCYFLDFIHFTRSTR